MKEEILEAKRRLYFLLMKLNDEQIQSLFEISNKK